MTVGSHWNTNTDMVSKRTYRLKLYIYYIDHEHRHERGKALVVQHFLNGCYVSDTLCPAATKDETPFSKSLQRNADGPVNGASTCDTRRLGYDVPSHLTALLRNWKRPRNQKAKGHWRCHTNVLSLDFYPENCVMASNHLKGRNTLNQTWISE